MLGVRVVLGIDLLAPLTNADQRGGDICGDVHLCLERRHRAHFTQLLATPGTTLEHSPPCSPLVLSKRAFA